MGKNAWKRPVTKRLCPKLMVVKSVASLSPFWIMNIHISAHFSASHWSISHEWVIVNKPEQLGFYGHRRSQKSEFRWEEIHTSLGGTYKVQIWLTFRRPDWHLGNLSVYCRRYWEGVVETFSCLPLRLQRSTTTLIKYWFPHPPPHFTGAKADDNERGVRLGRRVKSTSAA